ncbi:HAD-IC family P-type ATPase [Streptosporangiaceae bacterium NEAU-GS5]|nr:HAD-IC family P-type ATPase [Streptosporangiaceae bacterium NEAU-GS5]
MTGLTTAEVAERAARGEVNRVPRRSSRSLGAIVRANVLTLFNLVVGVLWVLILVFGNWRDGLFGLVIVANAGIGIVQELRAKRTLDRLAVVGEAPVRVRRDGADQEIPQAEIVLGDLVVLGPGDRLPVDGEVTDSDRLEVDESLLTGEADPLHKARGDRMLSGSFVVAGSGGYVATKVGREAYAAKLAEEASRFTLASSELRDGITAFIKYVTWLIVPIGILLLISQVRSATTVGEAVTGTVAGVVTMIPEGLVLMTSLAFAVGVIRLGRRRCLVQELPAIEGLARVDVLCVDKTGTLTAPGMDVAEVRTDVPEAIAALAYVDANPNPTMAAIRASLPDPGWTAEGKVPFSSARKWSGASFTGHGVWILGAPDVVLPPDDPTRVEAGDLAATGLRVLALCRTETLAETLAPAKGAGLVVLKQRIRPEAYETLRYFERQGVTVKVISGDDPAAVSAIAVSLDIPGAANAVDARTLGPEPGEALESNTVFGRVTPQQKRQFVRALQAGGHTVAMTGDGVNDVLALKDADLGVAMGSGSGATKAVAQVVLLDDSFATLPHVVAEGRRVLGNIERVSNLFLTKTVYAILTSLLTGIIGLTYPFLPRQLTLVSALTIGIPGFFLALAPNDERARPGFVPRVLRFAIPAGLACGIAAYAAYYLAELPPSAPASSKTVATITLFAVATWVLALIARPYTWWRIALVAAMAGVFVLVLALPWARDFFALSLQDVGNDAYALVIAAAACAALTLAQALTQASAVRISVARRR